ncbi:unnamed protein product [Amoebophrya sp. A120]|nr:unnamed protein product [Amoebophrya sp. A120]|eukprot:GSA120T00011764001.1
MGGQVKKDNYKSWGPPGGGYWVWKGKKGSGKGGGKKGNKAGKGWEMQMSKKITKWLRYNMRDEFPENESNWVHHTAVPGFGEEFTEPQLRAIIKADPDHLHAWDQYDKEDKERMDMGEEGPPTGLYVRSVKKNKIETKGNDLDAYWKTVDIAYAVKNRKEKEREALEEKEKENAAEE